jgi:hypothetical protein
MHETKHASDDRKAYMADLEKRAAAMSPLDLLDEIRRAYRNKEYIEGAAGLRVLKESLISNGREALDVGLKQNEHTLTGWGMQMYALGIIIEHSFEL